MGIRYLWGRRTGVCKAWFGTLPYVFVSEASKVEVTIRQMLFVHSTFRKLNLMKLQTIMGSPKHIDKSRDYDFLHPWLGTGLLTSHGKKWHSRRKVIDRKIPVVRKLVSFFFSLCRF